MARAIGDNLDWAVEVKVWFCKFIDAREAGNQRELRRAREELKRLGLIIRVRNDAKEASRSASNTGATRGTSG